MNRKEYDEIINRYVSEWLQPPKVPLSGLEPIPKEDKVCTDPAHNPPMHICIPYGMRYRHQCPRCGNEQIVMPTQVTF